MTDQPAEPIRKGILPATPPPEYEFHTAIGTLHGCVLVPSDAGPVVVRRRVTYGDWEPVRPDRWAGEPETDAVSAVPQPPADQAAALEAAIKQVEHVFTGEVNDDRALDLHSALIVLRSKLPCTCARSQGLHEQGCRRYVPGHDLLSPSRRLARGRAELRRMTDEAQPAVCIECGHPSGTHQEGEDPVTPGRCTACPDDDAWHDYHPAAARPDDTTGARPCR